MKSLYFKSNVFGGNRPVTPEMVTLADHLVAEFVQLNAGQGTPYLDVRELVVSGLHAAIFALQSADAVKHEADKGGNLSAKDWALWLENQLFIKPSDIGKTLMIERTLS